MIMNKLMLSFIPEFLCFSSEFISKAIMMKKRVSYIWFHNVLGQLGIYSCEVISQSGEIGGSAMNIGHLADHWIIVCMQIQDKWNPIYTGNAGSSIMLCWWITPNNISMS